MTTDDLRSAIGHRPKRTSNLNISESEYQLILSLLRKLALSFQAAYIGSIIMMSRNRQSIIDRHTANHDYEIDLKAELEIELLHDTIALLEQEELNDILCLLRFLSGGFANATNPA
jgi:predicted MarR family transcription regulator